ncbi:hypothetical protein P154DRAFT_420621, partial [Amniculicola lignicola CBS 123094]
VANVWQVFLSLLYVAQNALLSCLLVADEWSGFAIDRKTLRVAAPVGIQRSSYFISMPLRYSLPIMGVFTIMHWLLSQSTFIIRVLAFDWDGSVLPGWTTAGFSVIPSLISLMLGVSILLAYCLYAYFRRYPASPGMPLASTCSMAISANCHRPDRDTDAYLLPVQWGVYDPDDGDGRGLCAFTTSRFVQPPRVGQRLFGLSKKEASKANRLTEKGVQVLLRSWTQVKHILSFRIRRKK